MTLLKNLSNPTTSFLKFQFWSEIVNGCKPQCDVSRIGNLSPCKTVNYNFKWKPAMEKWKTGRKKKLKKWEFVKNETNS